MASASTLIKTGRAMPFLARAMPASISLCRVCNATQPSRQPYSTQPSKSTSTKQSAPVTVKGIRRRHRKGQKISMVTAYDFAQATLVDRSPVDMILVGDSLGMVALGHSSTIPVTMDDMLHHTRAVTRGASRPMVVADLPYGSHCDEKTAVTNAMRLLKEARAKAVKLEGGKEQAEVIRALTRAGIPVVGHIGLQPQHVNATGYAYVGTTQEEIEELLADAKAIQEAGCFSLVLECVPVEVAAAVTQSLAIPTIGIGAGSHTSGQVLVWHDMLGVFPSRPSFCKQYADVGGMIATQLTRYHEEVQGGTFPDERHVRHAKDVTLLSRALDGQEFPAPSPPSPTPPTLASSGSPRHVHILGSGSMAKLMAAKLALLGPSEVKVTMSDPWYTGQTAAIDAAGGILLQEAGSSSPSLVRGVNTKAEERADLVMVLTKSYQLQLEPERVDFSSMIKPDGVILSLQNGAGNLELLSRLCSSQVLLGTTSHGARTNSPGEVQHTGSGPTFIVAKSEVDEAAASRVTELLSAAGIDTAVTANEDVILEKVIVNAAINPISALLEVTNGKLLEEPEFLDRIILSVVEEGVRVLPNLARGKTASEKVKELVSKVRNVATQTSGNHSSMLADIARGTKTEIDSINGYLVKEGASLGVDAPVNSLLLALVKAKEHSRAR